MRDGRLGQLERLGQIADAAGFAAGETVDDRNAGRVGEGLEGGCELFSRGGLERWCAGTAAERLENRQRFHRRTSIYQLASRSSIDVDERRMRCEPAHVATTAATAAAATAASPSSAITATARERPWAVACAVPEHTSGPAEPAWVLDLSSPGWTRT